MELVGRGACSEELLNSREGERPCSCGVLEFHTVGMALAVEVLRCAELGPPAFASLWQGS